VARTLARCRGAWRGGRESIRIAFQATKTDNAICRANNVDREGTKVLCRGGDSEGSEEGHKGGR